MSWEGWSALSVVVLVFVLLARGRVAPDAALLGGVVALCALSPFSERFPDAATVARAFGNEALLTVAALYVLSGAMVRTGAIDGLTRLVLGRPRSLVGAQLRLTFPVALLSAFMNNTPVVAMTLPAVKEWAKRSRLDPARLLMPLSYAAVLGGVCTLIGTSTNLVVQGLLRQTGERTFDLFTVAPVGVPIAVVGLLYTAWATHVLLPARPAPEERIEDPRAYRVGMHAPVGPVETRRPERAGVAAAIGLAFVVLAACEPLTGLSVGAVALVAAGALVLTGCLSVTEARRSIDGSTLLAIGSALALATVLQSTGVAAALAQAIMAPTSAFGTWGALAGIYLTTLILTELVTNNAAAALVFPVALATATELHVSVFPFAVAIAVAASAGFASPLGYQTHLMVYGPGGYRFGDFLRVGLPLDLIVMAIAVTLIPWLFPF